uniref:Uncharacterized protein n=1 Tax=Anguilla anguilla TaxID=7936 RepID=A0A0E9SD53_ANGAN
MKTYMRVRCPGAGLVAADVDDGCRGACGIWSGAGCPPKSQPPLSTPHQTSYRHAKGLQS